jgi:hypothetical protein
VIASLRKNGSSSDIPQHESWTVDGASSGVGEGHASLHSHVAYYNKDDYLQFYAFQDGATVTTPTIDTAYSAVYITKVD